MRFTKLLIKHGNSGRAGGLALYFRWGGFTKPWRRGWWAAARHRLPAGTGWRQRHNRWSMRL